MNNIVIKNIEPQNIRISGAGEVIGITAVYVNGVNVTEGSVAYVIVPTKTSQLENNSGFLTQETDPTIPYYIKQIRLSDITRWNNKQDELVSGVNIKTINSNSLLGSGNIDITTSYTAGTGISISNENVISNDITSYNDLTNLPTIPTKISDLTNDSDFVESTSLAEVAFNGSYLALSNTPDSTSDFTNDGENGVDPFITNKTNSLENYYNIDYMWNLLPHLTDSDTNINLSPTVKDTTLKMSLNPSTLTQAGTPTPSSPQDIHTISGSNTIKVEGKNLYRIVDKSGTALTLTYSVENGVITLNGTSSEGSIILTNDNSLVLNSSDSYTYNIKQISGTCSSLTNINAVLSTAESGGILFIRNLSAVPYTFTGVSGNALVSRLYIGAGVVFNNFKFTIQLEKGSSATTYEPYTSYEEDIDLGDIEYCKIGTYSDRIFKNVSSDPDYSNERDEGAWYIKKNIGKMVYDGSENWLASGSQIAGSLKVYNQVAYPNTTQDFLTGIVCNMFEIGNITDYGSAVKTCIVPQKIGVNVCIKDTSMTLADFKTMLGTTNLVVYYHYTTPTYTQITGTLATQLDTIEDGLKAYNEQTNISQVNADLPFVINADTLKSLANL